MKSLMHAVIHWRLNAFSKQYHYDLSYARDVLSAGLRPFSAFSGIWRLAAFRHKGLPVAPWLAAKWVATSAEGCNPCQQLLIRMAQEAQIPPQQISAIQAGQLDAMDPDTALAYRWACAIIHPDQSSDADQLRQQVVRRWGHEGLVSMTLAMAGARSFPMVKRALGYAAACDLPHQKSTGT